MADGQAQYVFELLSIYMLGWSFKNFLLCKVPKFEYSFPRCSMKANSWGTTQDHNNYEVVPW